MVSTIVGANNKFSRSIILYEAGSFDYNACVAERYELVNKTIRQKEVIT
ncbi:MAG: hypothetical protein HFJ09_12965 [Lachnospiraceae bacterium]|nr:hypothetical protein [Lachnospiraceae bacterium]